MKFSTISNIGKIRDENEDSYGNVSIGEYDFFIVADGMGGHSCGDVASQLATKEFIDFLENADIEQYDNIISLQEKALEKANSAILEASPEGVTMGTTVVCLTLDYKNKLYHITHIGDSRAYLYREGILKQITRDHSLLNDLLDRGALREDEAETFINKSAVTRAVGISEKIEPESQSIEMEEFDVILLVTDGITNEISNDEISIIIKNNKDVYDISKNLVDMAIDNGGRDNITVTTVLV